VMLLLLLLNSAQQPCIRDCWQPMHFKSANQLHCLCTFISCFTCLHTGMCTIEHCFGDVLMGVVVLLMLHCAGSAAAPARQKQRQSSGMPGLNG
jgi:hypothetical protein